jgi:hypothetical protein
MHKTIKTSLIICLLTCFILTGLTTSAANAASMNSWTYGGSGSDYTYGLVATPDGGHMMVGSTCSYGAGGSDIWLVKVDAHGTMLWNKTFGGPFTDYGCNIIATLDGNYALVGYTCDNNATGDLESPDAWLIKVNSDGNMLWNQTYGTATDSDYATTLAATADGGYVLAGALYPNVTGTEEAWFFKVDAQGTLQWSKTFPVEGGNCFWCVTVASDGGYVLTGQTFASGNEDLWIVKLDVNGNQLWSKTYGGSSTDLGWWIINSPNGGYAVSGCTSSFGAGKTDFWLLKIDQNGALLWNQTYGGSDDDLGYVLAATPDGGYAMVGSTMSYGTAGSSDFWLIKTDSNGVMQWNQTMGGPDFDQGQCLLVTSDDIYSIAGITASYGAGATDGWLVISNAFDTATPTPTASPTSIPTVVPTETASATPTATASPLPTTQQASMQTILVAVVVVIAAAVSLVVVFKKRKQPA